jgi:hypothetical protein
MRTRLSKLLITAGIAGIGALLAPAASAAAAPPAPATQCHILYGLSQAGNAVEAFGEVICSDPDAGGPLFVTLQRLNPSTGLFVAVDAGDGAASHTCVGTAARTYRIKERTTFTRTFNCG